jgi:hypothetical protein
MNLPITSLITGDWRMTTDIIFIVCGSLALIFNLFLTMNAKEIVIVRPIVIRHPVNNVYPISTNNTTYMVTSNQPSAAFQQTVYQVPVVTYPSNNTNNGVIYQTSPPGYPPVNNNQQQQQPVLYSHGARQYLHSRAASHLPGPRLHL